MASRTIRIDCPIKNMKELRAFVGHVDSSITANDNDIKISFYDKNDQHEITAEYTEPIK